MKTVLYFLAVLIIWNSVCVSGKEFLEPSESPWTLYSLAEDHTRLPCRFNTSDSVVKVVQVMWTREKSRGGEEQIITAHFSEGQTENTGYAGRVRFESSNPIADSALILMGTSPADEGKYICKVATFPTGNFETKISLTVWNIGGQANAVRWMLSLEGRIFECTSSICSIRRRLVALKNFFKAKPIASLEPIIMVEGQSYSLAATCRSVAKPMAGLSWDTELPGRSKNHSFDDGVASIQFSLHPLRSMNGQKLDCLVWHPSQNGPQRITNNLTVHYPPNALISGYEDNWHVEMPEAVLQCKGQGNPKPHQFNWTRKGDILPEDVTVEGGMLRFGRPLRLTDKGAYVCTTTNLVGSGKAAIEINISESFVPGTSVNLIMMIIIGGVAALVVLFLIIVIISVFRHYKRKNQQLAIELNEKQVEISTLSRQASFRRVHSTPSENRYSEDTHALRVEGTLRTSLSSLERPRSRDSRSTLGGLDSLGRPAIYNTSRRGRDKIMEKGDRESTRLMMEYEQGSNVSQETQLLPPLHPSSYTTEQTAEMIRSRNGSAILLAEGRPQSGASTRGGSRGHHSPLIPTYPVLTDEEEGDSVSPTDEDLRVRRGLMEADAYENGGSETTSSLISEALSSHFERANGTLRPKSKPNNILLPANTTLLISPHSPPIHKAQIV